MLNHLEASSYLALEYEYVLSSITLTRLSSKPSGKVSHAIISRHSQDNWAAPKERVLGARKRSWKAQAREPSTFFDVSVSTNSKLVQFQSVLVAVSLSAAYAL